jgi:hypothetical protein
MSFSAHLLCIFKVCFIVTWWTLNNQLNSSLYRVINFQRKKYCKWMCLFSCTRQFRLVYWVFKEWMPRFQQTTDSIICMYESSKNIEEAWLIRDCAFRSYRVNFINICSCKNIKVTVQNWMWVTTDLSKAENSSVGKETRPHAGRPSNRK